jgi:hypothetical protein
MGRLFAPLIILSCFFAGIDSFAQIPFRVSDPELRLEGNLLVISYDILNSSIEDTFLIRIDITDEKGNPIPAKALSGDVGAPVAGGKGKQIAWDLEVDEIYMSARIYFEITARLVVPETDATVSGKSTTPGYSRGGIMLQSAVFPGLGLTRVTGNPHWLKGLAAYGSVAGSLILRQQARKNFELIDTEGDYGENQDLFDRSVRQDAASEVLAYTAAAIWAADLIWTVFATADGTLAHQRKTNGRYTGGWIAGGWNAGAWSTGGRIDPLSLAPMLTIRYTF